jgi:hypothetical protein
MTLNNVNIKLIGELKTAVFAIAASFFGKVNEQIGRGHGSNKLCCLQEQESVCVCGLLLLICEQVGVYMDVVSKTA